MPRGAVPNLEIEWAHIRRQLARRGIEAPAKPYWAEPGKVWMWRDGNKIGPYTASPDVLARYLQRGFTLKPIHRRTRNGDD